MIVFLKGNLVLWKCKYNNVAVADIDFVTN
jgi:hypothetical protein